MIDVKGALVSQQTLFNRVTVNLAENGEKAGSDSEVTSPFIASFSFDSNGLIVPEIFIGVPFKRPFTSMVALPLIVVE